MYYHKFEVWYNNSNNNIMIYRVEPIRPMAWEERFQNFTPGKKSQSSATGLPACQYQNNFSDI